MAIDRNKNRKVPGDTDGKVLHELELHTGYLHDISEYAQFIKKHIAEQKEKDGGSDASSEISKEKAEKAAFNPEEEAAILKSLEGLISTIDKIDPAKFNKHITVVKGVSGLVGEILHNIDVGSKDELEEKLAFIKSVGTLSTTIVGLADNILGAAIKLRFVRPFVGIIGNTLSQIIGKIGTKDSIEQAKNSADIIRIITEAIIGMSWKIAAAAPLMIIAYPAIAIFKGLLTLTNWAFGNISAAKIGTKEAFDVSRNAAKTIRIMTGAIVDMSWKIAAAAPLMILAFPAIVMFKGLLALTTWAFKHVDIDKDKVKVGAKAIAEIGLSLIAFAGSIVVAAFVMKYVTGAGIAGLLLLFSTLAITLLIFKHLAKDGNELSKGALAMVAISGTLVLFSLALIGSAAIISTNPIGVMAVVLTLAVFATTFYFIGKFAKDIAVGALVVLAMGFSMWIFSMGMVPLLETIAKNPMTSLAAIIGIPVALGALGVAYAALGAASEFIIPGALAVAAIGGSLWIIGKGLQAIASVPAITKEQADGWEMAIMAIMAGAGKAALWAIPAAIAMPSILMLSKALPSLAEGLFAWSSQGKMGKSLGELPQIKTNIALVLSTIPQIFAEIGKIDKGGEPGSLLKSIVGNDFSKGNIEQGISSTMKMGKNLSHLADGVFEWSSKGKMGKVINEIPTIKSNIASVLSAIPQIFGELGKLDKGGEPGSILKKLVGNDFSKGNIEQGISSSMRLGDNLTKLANGVFEWSSKGRLGSMTAKELKTITDNVTAVLSVLPQAFAEIGRQDKASEKHWWSDGDIKRGVELVSSLAPTLTAVANVVKVFSDLSTSKDGIKPEEMGKQIGMSIQWIAYGISQSGKYLVGNTANNISIGFNAVGTGISSITKNSNEAYAALDKLISLQKPFEAFMKLFLDFTKSLKEQQTAINGMQLKNLEAYSKLIDGLAGMGRSDANVFKENMGYLLGDKLQQPMNFRQPEVVADNTVSPRKAAVTVAKATEEKNIATKEHQSKVSEHNESLLEVMQGIQQVLGEISMLLKKDNSDMIATAIVQKLEHASPILVKMKEKFG